MSAGRPRLLDLFCGGGGASLGYHRAGFDVVGIDHAPQPDYPFELWQMDVFELEPWVLAGFDAVHAAPLWFRFAPLQLAARAQHDDHITPTLDLLEASGRPYVLESGTLGPLPRGELTMICGAAVGLEIVRHMWFATNWPLMAPPCAHRRGGTTDGSYIAYRSSGRVRAGRKTPPRRKTRDWMNAAELGWMTVKQARLASPPAYTELIGHQLMAEVLARSVSKEPAQ